MTSEDAMKRLSYEWLHILFVRCDAIRPVNGVALFRLSANGGTGPRSAAVFQQRPEGRQQLSNECECKQCCICDCLQFSFNLSGLFSTGLSSDDLLSISIKAGC